MGYQGALKESEGTFVPPSHQALSGLHPHIRESRVRARVLSGDLFLGRGAWGPSATIVFLTVAPWGDTWSGPCAWMEPVRHVIDIRPAFEPDDRLQVQERLRSLRLRARAKGLEVVPWNAAATEDTEGDAERKETNEAMRHLQAESFFDRG
jgi:hypothetical protein